jgi:hypothetical protein
VSYHSSVYGLNIQLNEPVPGLAVEKSVVNTPDVSVHFGAMPPWFHADESRREIWSIRPDQEPGATPRLIVWNLAALDHFHLRYADGTEFLIDKQGKSVWATWPEQTLTVEDTATYLLGPIMGFVLLLRGCVSLHASAISIQNRVVAIVGSAGTGKSTTAAALAELGYSILAEDVVTLQDLGNRFLVQPAYPCIRLWPSSVRALYGEHAELPRLTPTWDKCYLDLTQEQYQFQKSALPLAAIYVLGERQDNPSAPMIEQLAPTDALISLVGNTYASYLMDKQMRAREFELLGRLVKYVPVRRVVPHTNPALINRLCQTIVTDFDELNLVEASVETRNHAVHV